MLDWACVHHGLGAVDCCLIALGMYKAEYVKPPGGVS